MKKILNTLCIFLLSGTYAFSGPTGYDNSSKNVVLQDPLTPMKPFGVSSSCDDCWVGNSMDLYGGYTIAETEDYSISDGATAGLGYNNFFNKYLGIGLEAMWIDGPSVIHQVGSNLIARLPIELNSLCLAPYLMGGIGGHFNSINQVTTAGGVGLEFLLPNANCTGMFVESRYVYADKASDYTTFRLGIRKSF